MTSTYADAPTHAPHRARLHAGARSAHPASTRAWPAASTRADALRSRTEQRARITAAVVSLLALTTLLLATPQTVLIPLAVVLLAGLAVGGLFHLVEVRTRPYDTAAEPFDLGASHDA